MAKMKGGELIAEYLVKQKVPYVFGICGHGNVGILDPLYAVRDKIKLISPRHEQCAGHMADGYFRVKHQPVATLTSTGPGSANLVMSLATALSDSSAFLAITSNVPTSQAQPRAVPGDLQAQPGRLPLGAAPGGEARVPAHARGHAAARAAPGLRHHGHRPPGPGEPRRARTTSTRKRTTSSCRRASHVVRPAPPGRLAKPTSQRRWICWPTRMRPVIFIGHGATLSEAGPEITRAAEGLRHPGHHLAQRHGLRAGRRPAHARLHRPQRRLSGQPGRPPRRSGASPSARASTTARSSSWHPGYSWNFPKTKLIHVDIDPQELGRNYPPTLGIIADAKVFTRAAARRARPARAARPASLHAQYCGVARRGARLAAPNGRPSCGRTSATRPRRCGPSTSWTRCRRCCPTTRSSPRLRRAPQLVHAVLEAAAPAEHAEQLGLLVAWASACAACWARSSPRPTGPASRSAATAASP